MGRLPPVLLGLRPGCRRGAGTLAGHCAERSGQAGNHTVGNAVSKLVEIEGLALRLGHRTIHLLAQPANWH
jgi:hypothetical protein